MEVAKDLFYVVYHVNSEFVTWIFNLPHTWSVHHGEASLGSAGLAQSLPDFPL